MKAKWLVRKPVGCWFVCIISEAFSLCSLHAFWSQWLSMAVEAGPSKADAKEEDKLWEFSGSKILAESSAILGSSMRTPTALSLRWWRTRRQGGPRDPFCLCLQRWLVDFLWVQRPGVEFMVASFHWCRSPNTPGSLRFWRGCSLILMLDHWIGQHGDICSRFPVRQPPPPMVWSPKNPPLPAATYYVCLPTTCYSLLPIYYLLPITTYYYLLPTPHHPTPQGEGGLDDATITRVPWPWVGGGGGTQNLEHISSQQWLGEKTTWTNNKTDKNWE